MRRIAKGLVLAFALAFVIGLLAFAQKVDTTNGVKVVHNGKPGGWGAGPKISLEVVRTLGELEAQDENVAFHLPSDLALDKAGNIYVLDTGNHRIQKFSPDGRYLVTFGRKGQGPGEFVYPESIDIDARGNIYVSDANNKRIQVLTAEGKEERTVQMIEEAPGDIRLTTSGKIVTSAGSAPGMFSLDESEAKKLPKLIKVLDAKGAVEKEFGEPLNYEHFMLNRMGNRVRFALDDKDNVYLAFPYQNRIEKYSSDGKAVWRADRELDYSTEAPKDKGKTERQGGRIRVEAPRMNTCSVGIAVDGLGRIWVPTLKRQLREEEQVGISMGIAMTDGQRSMTMKPEGNIELRTSEAYRIEVYGPEGALLGSIPLSHFVDGIRIVKDRLFLLDRMRGAQILEYRILEK